MEPTESIDRLFVKACSNAKSFDRLYRLLLGHPDSPELWFAVGNAHQFLHGVSRDNFPTRCFKVCLQIDPGFADAYSKLGYRYYFLERYFDAESNLLQAIEHGGGDLSRHLLSIVYATTGRLHEAFVQLDRCADQHAVHIRGARMQFENGFFLHPGYLPVLPTANIAYEGG